MKKIITIFLGIVLSYAVTSAVNLHVSLPDSQGYQDVQRATQGQSEVTSDAGDVTTLIQTINEYLWIAVGIVCMVVIVMGGIKLVSSRGDEAAAKKANMTIVGAIVGIVIAIFSYLLVRVALNLF